jgi:endonuclease/exonuclease/phosphatase family metal-dependent hydrolase
MRRIVLLLLLSVVAIMAAEAKPNKKVTIKVGSYNLMTSDSRVKHIAKNADMSHQRYWFHSAQAIAAQVSDLDCDIIGLQEVCDSIWGLTGDKGFRKLMEDAGNTQYKWILYPNGSKGNLSYDVAIGYKSDVFTELESGIYWLAGIFDKSEALPTAPKGSKRPCVWAKLQHNQTGKILFFFSTHFVVPGISKEGNAYNAENCIKYAAELIGSRKTPSIIVGDFNATKGAPGFDVVEGSGRWHDVFYILKDEGLLDESETKKGTCNAKNEQSISGWRPDHITIDGNLSAESFKTVRSKYPTTDGTEHYPSDHFPIVAELKF